MTMLNIIPTITIWYGKTYFAYHAAHRVVSYAHQHHVGCAGFSKAV